MAKIRTLHVQTPKGFRLPLHFDVEDQQQQEDFRMLEIALACPDTSLALHESLCQEIEVFKFRCRREFTASMSENDKNRPIAYKTEDEKKRHIRTQQSLVEDAVLKVSSYWLYARRQLKRALDQHVKEHNVLEREKARQENQIAEGSASA